MQVADCITSLLKRCHSHPRQVCVFVITGTGFPHHIDFQEDGSKVSGRGVLVQNLPRVYGLEARNPGTTPDHTVAGGSSRDVMITYAAVDGDHDRPRPLSSPHYTPAPGDWDSAPWPTLYHPAS